MTPVFFIKGKVRPYIERSVFFHYRYDESEVVNDGIIVHDQYASVSSLVVTPRDKKFDGMMAIIIASHFSDEG